MPQKRRLLLLIAALAWSGFVIAVYFVVQKPLALQVLDHLIGLLWTLLVTSMLVLNALALGSFTLERFVAEPAEVPSWLALAGGIGLGQLGLLGFGLAAARIAQVPVLLGIQVVLLSWFSWRGTMGENFARIKGLLAQIKASASQVPAWMRWAAGLALSLTVLMTFLPPIEAFDALLYHLTVPALWLRDGGLQAYNMPPYWFPSLVEGAYVWGLGLGTDIVPQQLHFFWFLFAAILLWDWSRKLWDELTAWWAWMFLVSMPSLLLLASWAYTDMALTFFSVATLYALWQGHNRGSTAWWRIAAIATGLAMGVKYTSVILPVTAILLIFIWKRRQPKAWLVEVIRFGLLAGLTGCVWYLRNWLWMGNPFYPFVFGGRYWDAFRAALYAGTGTGAGWDLKAILALPLTITLGYQDITFFDGNIGPLFLLALPMAMWIFIRIRGFEPAQQRALAVIGLFASLSALLWTYGYVTTRNLWQARLLFPACIPFAIPVSLGLLSLRRLDTSKLRLSFIVSGMAMAAIFVSLLNRGLSVIYRDPLASMTGITSREGFTEKFQPGYAYLLKLIDRTPKDANVYFLFEPRSYGVARAVQTDTLLDNFPHDVFLYKDPENILRAWQQQGYTHVLVSRRGAHFVLGESEEMELLEQTLRLLKPVETLPDQEYSLYQIRAP